jgi:hypothetical protein
VKKVQFSTFNSKFNSVILIHNVMHSLTLSNVRLLGLSALSQTFGLVTAMRGVAALMGKTKNLYSILERYSIFLFVSPRRKKWEFHSVRLRRNFCLANGQGGPSVRLS